MATLLRWRCLVYACQLALLANCCHCLLLTSCGRCPLQRAEKLLKPLPDKPVPCDKLPDGPEPVQVEVEYVAREDLQVGVPRARCQRGGQAALAGWVPAKPRRWPSNVPHDALGFPVSKRRVASVLETERAQL